MFRNKMLPLVYAFLPITTEKSYTRVINCLNVEYRKLEYLITH